ncbi:MAG: ROK family protein [Bdellovibrionales bacterium]|nr:ROK family protein [Bdellovibrionales bacterium]
MRRSFTVGFDLGGTKLAAALVDERGRVVAYGRDRIANEKFLPTPKVGYKAVLSRMVRFAQEFRDGFPSAFLRGSFLGFGLASAGPLNAETGMLLDAVHLKPWGRAPIRRDLEAALRKEKFQGPVMFQNDAIAASLAEGWVGGAKRLRTWATVTLGTGVGTGVIFQGCPLQTAGMGSEFGHLIADLSRIGNPATDLMKHTVEGIASGTGILRRAREQGFAGLSVEELVETIQGGESRWLKLFDEAADAWAALFFNLSVGLHVEKILVGGGLLAVKSLYWDRMVSRYNDLIRSWNPAFLAKVSPARVGERAAVVGAAYLPRGVP